MRRKEKSIIIQAIKNVFQQLPISEAISTKLKQLACDLFSRKVFTTSFSGVVVAGFGRDDLFPCLCSYQLDCVFANRLKYFKNKSFSVQRDVSASIIPFAQDDMVFRFMQGIDANLLKYMRGYMHGHVMENILNVVKDINSISDESKEELNERLRDYGKDALQRFLENTEHLMNERFIQPVVQSVAMLPLDELAVMAETFVNLTSFKRKMSLDEETVGGPTDVAVITKMDGFIWVKKKSIKEENPG